MTIGFSVSRFGRQHHPIIPYVFTSHRSRNPSISLSFMLPSARQRT
jgi:hypothetical protein